jgi:hypothetical protein
MTSSETPIACYIASLEGLAARVREYCLKAWSIEAGHIQPFPTARAELLGRTGFAHPRNRAERRNLDKLMSRITLTRVLFTSDCLPDVPLQATYFVEVANTVRVSVRVLEQTEAVAVPENGVPVHSNESTKSKRGGKRPGAGRKPNLARRLLKGFSREAKATLTLEW